jgi:hypothetical protein
MAIATESLPVIAARSARCDPETDLIIVELTNGQWFAFDPRQFERLKSAPAPLLKCVEVSPSGLRLCWHWLGEDIPIQRLLIDLTSYPRKTLGDPSKVC